MTVTRLMAIVGMLFTLLIGIMKMFGVLPMGIGFSVGLLYVIVSMMIIAGVLGLDATKGEKGDQGLRGMTGAMGARGKDGDDNGEEECPEIQYYEGQLANYVTLGDYTLSLPKDSIAGISKKDKDDSPEMVTAKAYDNMLINKRKLEAETNKENK